APARSGRRARGAPSSPRARPRAPRRSPARRRSGRSKRHRASWGSSVVLAVGGLLVFLLGRGSLLRRVALARLARLPGGVTGLGDLLGDVVVGSLAED